MENIVQKRWYLSTWVIAILIALWPISWIPTIIGLILIIMQQKVYGSAVDILNKATQEAENLINEATQQVEQLNREKESLEKRLAEMNKEYAQLQDELKSLTKEVITATVDISAYDQFTSEEIKNKLQMLRLNQQDLIKKDKALIITATDKKKIVENNAKQILRCFNAECENIISQVNARNVDTARGKIIKSFETLNRIFATDGIAISKEYLEAKLEELNLVYAYAIKKEQERELQKAIREQLLEEEKARRELERERLRLEKEETHFRNEIKKLMAHMQKATTEVEKSFYIEQIKSLEEKLEQIVKDKEDIINREQNTRAGFVYIISNIGAFGEDVYKIGMTRRLDPLDRIYELGDASVPFKFDVHAIIFSEDAPALEAALHERFREYELNKLNPRKEFFKVPLSEIQKAVSELHSGPVSWTIEPPAEEYRESLRRAGKLAS
ncbi:T5orf172 domain-containing protein [Thermanaeromonas toyohensis ToBE]|uniref:T5orf172 domain-containing protein n=1 Tax=Thermanaeromonas toyohensis ToBE TaxID=698762 RepID=A0A1W1VXD1_9FIRM|nr:DUF4041 domain-containing protein [Thermanaeromonas toyohensis]SMB98027.1 T5orf172 domain-containing protein [Thermanaeromonas toyohensis ToBE]